MAKDVLDKKTTTATILATGTAAPTFQFLQVKKRKHVRTTGLTSCWLSCPCVTIFMSKKAKTDTCDRYDTAAAPALQFSQLKKRKSLDKKAPAAGTPALRFLEVEKRK